MDEQVEKTSPHNKKFRGFLDLMVSVKSADPAASSDPDTFNGGLGGAL